MSLGSCREWAFAVSRTMGLGMATATRSTTPLSVVVLLVLLTTAMVNPCCADGATISTDDCERLSERSLHYTQEKAPRDLSGLVCLLCTCFCRFNSMKLFFVGGRADTRFTNTAFLELLSAPSGCETHQPSSTGCGGRRGGMAWWGSARHRGRAHCKGQSDPVGVRGSS